MTNSPASWLDLDVFQVYRAWTENAVTWNLAQSGANWTTAGCNGTGTDRAATPAASARIQQTAGGTVTISLPASLLAGWLADPGSNQGVLLRPKLNTGGAILTYTFGSSEHGTTAYRPKLTVSYTTPPGRLSPDTAALLAALPVGLAQPAGWTASAPDAPAVTSVPTGQTWRSYYFLGGQRIALRERTGSAAGVVHYLLTDQLGSTAVTASETGALEARQWYYPFGGPRPAGASTLPTDRRFTGQRSEEATLGSLYDFVARPYSPALGRFLAPDSIVPEPGNPQSLNRYSYALNQPLKYTDPTGHAQISDDAGGWGGAIGLAAGYALRAQLQVWLAEKVAAVNEFFASGLGHLAVQHAQQADAGANASGQGGNTASPNPLGPNDPWDKFNGLRQNGYSEIEAAVEATTQGIGDRLVIGPYRTDPGVLNYIQEATKNGGKYFNAGQKLWDKFVANGTAWQVNSEVIYRQMQAGISKIDISSGLTIAQILADPQRNQSLAAEVQYIMGLMNQFGYVINSTGTGWVLGP